MLKKLKLLAPLIGSSLVSGGAVYMYLDKDLELKGASEDEIQACITCGAMLVREGSKFFSESELQKLETFLEEKKNETK